jgi:hypothetical protein
VAVALVVVAGGAVAWAGRPPGVRTEVLEVPGVAEPASAR